MITICTHSQIPLHLEFWKYLARRIMRKYTGPDAVKDSLIRGLTELDIDFRLNNPSVGDTVTVLSGPNALKDAIKNKRAGRIRKLVAGPNIVILPNYNDGLILDNAIDIILVPSDWVAELWTKEVPKIADKIKVWPAGVAISPPSTRLGLPIIYDKLNDSVLIEKITSQIGDHHLFKYGYFQHADYLSALSEAPFLIYLAESESQGMALQEAWAHDIPTLVNYSDTWRNGDMTWHAPQINAPYLTPELGTVFDKISDIPGMIDSIKDLRPKNYCDENLSDTVCAQKLLELI